MADIFNFGGFIKNTNKKREKEAGLSDESQPSSPEVKAPAMSQSEFSGYGAEGYRSKKKAMPPASMKP